MTDDRIREQNEATLRMQFEMLNSRTLGWTKTQIEEWFLTRNPNFGGLKPIHLVTSGRHGFLERWIMGCLDTADPARRLTTEFHLPLKRIP